MRANNLFGHTLITPDSDCAAYINDFIYFSCINTDPGTNFGRQIAVLSLENPYPAF